MSLTYIASERVIPGYGGGMSSAKAVSGGFISAAEAETQAVAEAEAEGQLKQQLPASCSEWRAAHFTPSLAHEAGRKPHSHPKQWHTQHTQRHTQRHTPSQALESDTRVLAYEAGRKHQVRVNTISAVSTLIQFCSSE